MKLDIEMKELPFLVDVLAKRKKQLEDEKLRWGDIFAYGKELEAMSNWCDAIGSWQQFAAFALAMESLSMLMRNIEDVFGRLAEYRPFTPKG